MIEIIKTLLISLSFAATGAGIAWSVTSQASEIPLVSEMASRPAVKADRLDTPFSKADRLEIVAASRPVGAVTIVSVKGQASSTVFRAPL